MSRILSSSSDGVVRRLWGYVSAHKWYYFMGVVATLLIAACDAFLAKAVQPFIDSVFLHSRSSNVAVRYFIFIFIFIFTLRSCGAFLSKYSIKRVAQSVVFQLRKSLFKRFQAYPLTVFDQHGVGELGSFFVYHVEKISGACASTFVTAIKSASMVIGMLVVMLSVNWQLTLLLIVLLPFVSLIFIFAARRLKKLNVILQRSVGGLLSGVNAVVAGKKVLRVFQASDFFTNRFEVENKKNFSFNMKCVVTSGLSGVGTQFLIAVIIALILYLLKTFFYDMSPGSFSAFVVAIAGIAQPARSLPKLNEAIQSALAGVGEVFSMLDKPIECDVSEAVDLDKVTSVVFDAAGFSYDQCDTAVLSDVSFSVDQAQFVAVIGASGSGKSTLISLLSGLYCPTLGDIKFNGLSSKLLSLMSLRRQVSVVGQPPVIFEMTIRDNITLGADQIDVDRLDWAIEHAQVNLFLRHLPAGLDTILGPGAHQLSAGQSQRIEIARAIYKRASIYIFDEATSALDDQVSALINDLIVSLSRESIVFFITHRLDSINAADQVLLVRGGRVMSYASKKDALDSLVVADVG